MANPKTIPQLPYVGSSGYTTNDIVPFVNYDVVSGTTKHTLLTDLKDYFSGSTVTITGGTNIEIVGSYPDFGIEFTGTTSTPFTGGTVSGATEFTNGLSANTLTVNGVNITGDTYVTGMTFNQSNYDLSIERNDGVTFTESLAILASDLTVTGGTYNPNTGEATFTNNTGGTFNVTGFLTGFTDTYVTGATYNDSNTFTFTNNTGGTFDVSFNIVTGLTATTISATTYQNLPDNVTGYYLPLSGGTLTGNTNFTNGLSANTLTVNGVNITGDTYVTGGTYYTGGTIIFDYNTGSNFQVTGLTEDLNNEIAGLAETDEETIELNLTTNKIQLKETVASATGGTRTFQGNFAISGGTFNLDTIGSGSPVINLGLDSSGEVVTGTTDQTVTITGGTNIEIVGSYPDFGVNYTGQTTFDYLPISGGTVTGATEFTNGLTANTISATTYQNLPVSALTEGTNISITNTSGNHTISVTGLTNTQQVTPYNNSGSGSTISWDVSGTSTNYEATLTATTTLNLTNVRNGDFGTIIISQDGVGGRTLTLGTVNGSSTTHRVVNGGGGSIVLTSNANAIDILTFTYNGSIMFWTVGNDYT